MPAFTTYQRPCDYCDMLAGEEMVYSADDDGEAPWACHACYIARNGNSPSTREVPVDLNDEDGGWEPEAQETTDDECSIPSSPLHLAPLPNRPRRLVSFEQEVGRGGNWIAEQLHAQGYAEDRYISGYHSRGSGRDGEMVWVEEDASVAAEVIWSKLDLSDPSVASRVESALEVIRGGIRGGEVKLDMRCGLHVHVGLGRDEMLGTPAYGSKSVESLYHLWNYLEDTIYRLASANWRCHRTEVADYNYAPQTRKGLTGRVAIGEAFQHSRGALNLSNYLNARGSCRCGAFTFAAWEECRCNLPMPTVEFRVFNASANKRKIRAYVALCLALVAYAEQHEVTDEEFPVMAFEGTEMLNMEASKERLAFILDKLPLTREERIDIVYCAEKSSLREVVGAMKS